MESCKLSNLHAQCNMHVDEYATINKCNIFEKEKRTQYISNGHIMLSYVIAYHKQNKTKHMSWEVYTHSIFTHPQRPNIKYYFILKKPVVKHICKFSFFINTILGPKFEN